MKLFLAGIESQRHVDCSKMLYALASFWYLKTTANEKRVMGTIYPRVQMFLLDSGAFTFLNSKKMDVSLDKYLDQYIDFINKYDIRYFFELDVDSVVGIQKVEEYRKILESRTRKKCIPVWHVSRGKDYWIKMCKEYDYVAYGGIATDGVSRRTIEKHLPWFLEIAKQYNCKVHLLGFTPADVKKYDAYSCDSTSWSGGGRFGSVFMFDGKTIKVTQPGKRGEILRRVKNVPKLNQHNFNQWVYFQKYLSNS